MLLTHGCDWLLRLTSRLNERLNSSFGAPAKVLFPKKAGWLFSLLVSAAWPLFAQPTEFGSVHIPRVSSPPRLEEFLSMEPAPRWKGKLAEVNQFTQRIPRDGAPSSQKTEVYLGYDDKNLYAIFVCFDTEPQKVRARLSRREDLIEDDSVEIMLDTFHDHRRAYAFLANPVGVQADALWTEGSEFDFSFDTVFNTAGRLTDRGFVVWMAIPFRSLRFASNDPQTWGILLNRESRVTMKTPSGRPIPAASRDA